MNLLESKVHIINKINLIYEVQKWKKNRVRTDKENVNIYYFTPFGKRLIKKEIRKEAPTSMVKTFIKASK
jgi:hypothetical protein